MSLAISNKRFPSIPEVAEDSFPKASKMHADISATTVITHSRALHYNHPNTIPFTESRCKLVLSVLQDLPCCSEFCLWGIDFNPIVLRSIPDELEKRGVRKVSFVFRETLNTEVSGTHSPLTTNFEAKDRLDVPKPAGLFCNHFNVEALSAFIHSLSFLDDLNIEIDSDPKEVLEIKWENYNNRNTCKASFVFRDYANVESLDQGGSAEKTEAIALSPVVNGGQTTEKVKLLWALIKKMYLPAELHIGGINPEPAAFETFDEICTHVSIERVSIQFASTATCEDKKVQSLLTTLLENGDITRVAFGFPDSVKLGITKKQRSLLTLDPACELYMYNSTTGVHFLPVSQGEERIPKVFSINTAKAVLQGNGVDSDSRDLAELKEFSLGSIKVRQPLIDTVVNSIFDASPNLVSMRFVNIDPDKRALNVLAERITASNVSRVFLSLSRTASLKTTDLLEFLGALVKNGKISHIEFLVATPQMLMFRLEGDLLQSLEDRSAPLVLKYSKSSLSYIYQIGASGHSHIIYSHELTEDGKQPYWPIHKTE